VRPDEPREQRGRVRRQGHEGGAPERERRPDYEVVTALLIDRVRELDDPLADAGAKIANPFQVRVDLQRCGDEAEVGRDRLSSSQRRRQRSSVSISS